MLEGLPYVAILLLLLLLVLFLILLFIFLFLFCASRLSTRQSKVDGTVVARQSVGVLDVEAIDGSGGGGVAQPLQGRAEQGFSRVAIVDEAEFGGNRHAVAEDPPIQEVELTGDGVAFDLLITGDPGIQGVSEAGVEGHERASEATDRVFRCKSEDSIDCRIWELIAFLRTRGRACSKARARVRSCDRDGSKPRRIGKLAVPKDDRRVMSALRVGTSEGRAPPCKRVVGIRNGFDAL